MAARSAISTITGPPSLKRMRTFRLVVVVDQTVFLKGRGKYVKNKYEVRAPIPRASRGGEGTRSNCSNTCAENNMRPRQQEQYQRRCRLGRGT